MSPDGASTYAACAGALAIVAGVLALRLVAERRRRKAAAFVGRWPIAAVAPDQVADVFMPGLHGPSIETEIAFIGRGPYMVVGGTSDTEAWILAVLAKRAHVLFEFGTCTGKTAYLWARNAPPTARIVTLTLPPRAHGGYTRGRGDDWRDERGALHESAFERFLYTGTCVEDRITQLFGDSKTVDLSPWAGACDVVFVDGSHAYSYVQSDGRRALSLVRPGGLVLWHDYAGRRHSPGVYRALNELARELPLVRLAGTSLVAYRAPS